MSNAASKHQKITAKPLSLQTLYGSAGTNTSSQKFGIFTTTKQPTTDHASDHSSIASLNFNTKRYQSLFEQLSFKNPRVENCPLPEGTLFVAFSKHSFNKNAQDRLVLVFPFDVKNNHAMWGNIILLANKEQSDVGVLRLAQPSTCKKITSGEHVFYLVDASILRQGRKVYSPKDSAASVHNARFMTTKSATISAADHNSAFTPDDDRYHQQRYR
jgi:hypothetical protein